MGRGPGARRGEERGGYRVVRCPVVFLSRPLRIALLSYRSKPHCGGQGVYVRQLSRELHALGHHVEVFSGQPYPDLDPGPVLREIPASICTVTTTRSARPAGASTGTGRTVSRPR